MPTIDERARLDLFTAVQDALGPRHADTLMSLLPPVGWADVATKHDLHELERRLGHRFEAVDLRFEELERRLDHRFEAVNLRFESLEHKLTARIDQTARDTVRTMVLAMMGTMLTFTSLILATGILSR